MAVVHIKCQISDELLQPWLQHLRDFDIIHPGCKFEILADVPDLTFAEMLEKVRIEPGLTFQQIYERKK